MMSGELYRRVAGRDRFLLVQWDTLLLQRGCMTPFLGLDFVGAAWGFQDYYGNGGLTLRSKSRVLQLVGAGLMRKYVRARCLNEDRQFAKELKALVSTAEPRYNDADAVCGDAELFARNATPHTAEAAIANISAFTDLS